MVVSSKDSVVEKALPFDRPFEIQVSDQEESGHIRPHICTGLMLIVALIVAMWDSKVHVRSHAYDSTQCQIRIHELGLACIQKPTNLNKICIAVLDRVLACVEHRPDHETLRSRLVDVTMLVCPRYEAILNCTRSADAFGVFTRSKIRSALGV